MSEAETILNEKLIEHCFSDTKEIVRVAIIKAMDEYRNAVEKRIAKELKIILMFHETGRHGSARVKLEQLIKELE